MTEEKKEETSTVEEEQTTDTSEEVTEEQEAPVEPSQGSKTEEEYQAELERLRADKEKAEKAAAENAFKARKQKREEDDDEEPEEKPITKSDLLEFETRLTKKQQEDKATELANQMASSKAEADLILEYYNSRVTPSGNVKEDMKIAYAIANRNKILQENSEAKRSLASKENLQRQDASDTRQNVGQEPNISDQTKSFLQSANMVWNGQTRRYEGKKTWYDPKTDQSGRI